MTPDALPHAQRAPRPLTRAVASWPPAARVLPATHRSGVRSELGVRRIVSRVWLTLLCVALACASASPAHAQDEGELDTPRGHWFIGGYYRHDWIPSYMLGMFLSRAPSITNDGLGLTVSHRSADGFTAQLGLGYMPYTFDGAFTAESTLPEDTEYVTSDLELVHLTGSLLWPIELHRALTLEFGFGLDVGVFMGDVIRTEAYPDANGDFQACNAPHSPTVIGPDQDVNGVPIEYCAQALDDNLQPIESNRAQDKGEQYGVKETRIPAVMAFPMLPHLALRFAPWERLAFKIEFAFGIAQIWAGASVHVGFGGYKTRVYVEPDVDEPRAPAPVAAAAPTGRVLGKVMTKGTSQPIVGAAIRSKRLLSVLQSDERGYFIVDKIEPGAVRFEITRADFEPGECSTKVPVGGGEVVLHCFLVEQPTLGAISGQVKDEQGAPVSRARVGIMGPNINGEVLTSNEGLFALPDAPAGAYRIRVDAEDYLMQLVEVEVAPRDTALPQIILIAKPKTSLVTLKASEIQISQQINFATNSAEIGASSDALMREIADVLLRHEEITQLEIQGHTDNKGGRQHNLELSQARADAVREYLARSGVAADRLRARGYGQDVPLVSNNTAANRAKNRRVQFIIVR